MVGRYLSFGPVLPPGNVVLQVFHLEIMRKLQQLLFLGTRRREIGVKKNWGHCSDFGRFWAELEIGGSRASQKVLQRDAVWENGDFGCPQGARGCFGAGMGCARVGGRSERAAGAPAGGPTWQSIMASSSFSSIFFSPVSAHRRASRTGPSGRLPSFFRGASQSGDKATGRSSGEVVPGRPVKLPR